MNDGWMDVDNNVIDCQVKEEWDLLDALLDDRNDAIQWSWLSNKMSLLSPCEVFFVGASFFYGQCRLVRACDVTNSIASNGGLTQQQPNHRLTIRQIALSFPIPYVIQVIASRKKLPRLHYLYNSLTQKLLCTFY